MRLAREIRTGAPAEQAWRAVAGGAWAGAVRLDAGGAGAAGALRLVDSDADAGRAGVHGQVRLVGGWGGVTLTGAVTLSGSGSAPGALALDAEAIVTGDADDAMAEALAATLAARIERAVRDLDASVADDPAWRRRLAARAALAVGVGVAAGLAGAAWDRRRRG